MRLVSIVYLLMLLFPFARGTLCAYNEEEIKSISVGLSKNNTDAVKGILAAGVLLSHLAGHTSYHLPLFSFKVLGCIGVGCFFFLSGYGLIKASMKEKFYEGYLKRHTSKLLLPFLVMFIIWVIIFHVLFKEPLSNLLHSFAVGAPVSNSWYVFASLYCYFLFWEGRNQSFWKRQCIILVGLIIWILIFAVVVGWPDWWYKTIACFYIGIIWGEYSQKIRSYICHNYPLLLIVSIMAVVAAYILPAWAGKMISGKLLWLLNDIAMAISGVLFMAIVLEKVSLRNRVTIFLGRISFYLYLLHGIVIRLTDKILPKWGTMDTPMFKQELVSVMVVSVSILFALMTTIMTDRIRLYMGLKRVH